MLLGDDVRRFAAFCSEITMTVVLLQGQLYISIPEELKVGNVMLAYPGRDFHAILWWGRIRLSASQMKVLCVFYLCIKERSNTVVFLASDFVG